MFESIVYYSARVWGALVRTLPVGLAMASGRLLGRIFYYVLVKRRRQVYLNLRMAFSGEKTPAEIRRITRQVFLNYGQNIIDLLRLPLMTQDRLERYVTMEGQEHVRAALENKKGVILLAMHSGSWEMSSLGSVLLGVPYQVMVKPQSRFRRLNALLNDYRRGRGAVILERGMGTRGLIQSLRRNELIGMVVDQGGRSGIRVPFFGREASLASGAVRMALKSGTAICFAVIRREGGTHHRLTISPPLSLERTGDLQRDLVTNLTRIAGIMEGHIRADPAEYMWFYKIWKYSRQAVIGILDDGRTGHLRQSQCVAGILTQALQKKGIRAETRILPVEYRNFFAARSFAVLGALAGGPISRWLDRFLTAGSFAQLMSVKMDYIVSCGSAGGPVNHVVGRDLGARRIAILKPGLAALSHFDLVILPEHDRPRRGEAAKNIVFTKGAPNLINEAYLDEQAAGLLRRFSHLKLTAPLRIGVLLGGDTKNFVLREQTVRMVVHQLREVAEELRADILLTTSRRTSARVENMVNRELRRHPRCSLLILANRNNVPEAVGGILALSDILLVSGDSISMISEAACAGKKTIVFPVHARTPMARRDHKHNRFIDILNERGYILSADSKDVKTAVYNLVKNKIQLRALDDNKFLEIAIRRII